MWVILFVSNYVLWSRHDNVKIGDLGVAKVLTTQLRAAHTGVGTPYYLSPEVAQRRPYNGKARLVYYLCACGRRWNSTDTRSLLFQIPVP
jgi:serine/threonine protein kinase